MTGLFSSTALAAEATSERNTTFSAGSAHPARTFSLRLRIILRRRCPHDRLPAMVFSLRAVLAPGAAGTDPLSHRVVAVAALPPARNRCPRSTRPSLGRRDASRALAERTVSSFANLKALPGFARLDGRPPQPAKSARSGDPGEGGRPYASSSWFLAARYFCRNCRLLRPASRQMVWSSKPWPAPG